MHRVVCSNAADAAERVRSVTGVESTTIVAHANVATYGILRLEPAEVLRRI